MEKRTRQTKPWYENDPASQKVVRKMAAAKSARERAAGNDVTPLDVLREIYGDKKQPPALRVTAAQAAAPYIHRKQPVAVEHHGGSQPVMINVIGVDGGLSLPGVASIAIDGQCVNLPTVDTGTDDDDHD